MSQAKQSIQQKLQAVDVANLRCARIILEQWRREQAQVSANSRCTLPDSPPSDGAEEVEFGLEVEWAKRVLAASVDGKTAA